MSDFVHLHVHGEHSFLDGLGTASHRAGRAAQLNQSHLALTDHGNLCGALHHVKACEENSVQPILGIEAYFKPKFEKTKDRWHLVLLAENQEGWNNLMKLSSEAWRNGFYYKPNVDWEMLEKYSTGIWASASCLSGYLPKMYLTGEDKLFEEGLEQFNHIFPDRFYLEIQPHDIQDQRSWNIKATEIAAKNNIPLVATVDVHYPFEDWHDTHDILLMINTKQTFNKRLEKDKIGEDYLQFSGNTFYIMSASEILGAFRENHPDIDDTTITIAIETSAKIAKQFEEIKFSKEKKLPKVTESADESERVIREWCEEGLVAIGRLADKRYKSRYEREMSILRANDILDYFVLVGRTVRSAKDTGIRVGAGRGSAAGSLVAYLSRITCIDPIGHELLFERFINEGRKDLPDIDVDFQHDRRKDVKKWLANEFGQNSVAEIATFGTFSMKNTMQYVARVYDEPYALVESVTKTIDASTKKMSRDEDLDISLETLRQINPKVNEFFDSRAEQWKHCLRLEGQVKQLGKHAAGVIITPGPITDYMPLMRAARDKTEGKDELITSWGDAANMPIISEYGFVKLDILGTDSLTKQALIESNEFYESIENYPIIEDPDKFDPEIIEEFAKGHTLGIFQFEPDGITSYLKTLKPTTFTDLVAANALYRPGPMDSGMHTEYVARKNGNKKWKLPHKSLEPFLGRTYGIMVFQEQVMAVCRELGGFTDVEANDVRKAMGKMYRLGMSEVKKFMRKSGYEQKFLSGCTERGLSKDAAKKVWGEVLTFGGYGFAKNHSAPYSLQAYQDMDRKKFKDAEFYTSLLTNDPEKIGRVHDEVRSRGLKFLLPDINLSEKDFAVEEDAIRIGLSSIKDVGPQAVKEIIDNRPYSSYDDFVEKVSKRKCNEMRLRALIDAGAFDFWGMRDEMSVFEKRKAEKERLKFALTGSDLESDKIRKQEIELRTDTREQYEKKDYVTVGGTIISLREITTKNANKMAFAVIRNDVDEYEATLFAKTWQELKPMFIEGEEVLIAGPKSDKGIKVELARTLDELLDAEGLI